MTYLALNSGASIPQVGLGTSRTGDPAAAVTSALQIGYRHLDTAQMYGNEAEVGQGIRDSGVDREEIFITTKLNNANHAPADVFTTFEESLQKLAVDYVDLFLIHWPVTSENTDHVQTWKALIELAESGRAKSIGVSNFQPEHLDRIIEGTGVVPAINQIEIHPAFANNQVREYCASKGIAVEAWSPIGRGDSLSTPAIVDIAAELDRTEAQVILCWHIQRGDVVIPKSDNPDRQRSNLDVFTFELTEAQMQAINALDKGEDGRRGPHPNSIS